MLKKTIKYTNFNNEEVEEDFFFHLSQAELVELELSREGGLKASLERIVAAEDGPAMVREFKNIILGSYGVKSEDGKRFIKNQQLRDEFESSEAYSTLFMELVTDGDVAADFINGIIPKGMTEEAAANLASAQKPVEEGSSQKRVVTPKEVGEMESHEFAELKQQINAGKAMIKETIVP